MRETDRVIGLIDRVAGCFSDERGKSRVVHSLHTLIGQRIVGLALGYEDVNDHDELRHDPVLALFSERLAPRGSDCAPLGGKSTINRLEHAPRNDEDRYRKIAVDRSAVENLLVDLFLDAHAKAPKEIVLDLGATDDPLHGHQEGRLRWKTGSRNSSSISSPTAPQRRPWRQTSCACGSRRSPMC